LTRKTWWFALAVGCYAALVVVASVLEAPIAADPNSLRWGGDRSGGGPYIYTSKSGDLVGFETELAELLAGELGLSARFVQGPWDKLPDRLTRGDIDIVLNGYEWTSEREKKWASTIPYYIYRLQLLARQDDWRFRSWDDLRARPGEPLRKVGVLAGSAAQRYVKKTFGEDVEILAYTEGVTSAMRLVEQGQLDATVQDLPAAIFYASKFPALHAIEETVAPSRFPYYVIFVRREDHELLLRLNDALRRALKSGSLERLYRRYHLWNDDQAKLATLAEAWPPTDSAPEEEEDEEGGQAFVPLLARAAMTTVLLACLSMPLAMVIGLLVAVGRLYGPSWLNWILTLYVEFLRGTPLLLQLYVIFFLLPAAEIRIPAFWAGVMGLAINYSAYEAENYRAGFLAIPKGQMEAALALGMSTWAALRRVIIPQAVRIVIPPVTNDFIALFKDTSVCSVIAVTELTGRYSELYNNHPNAILQLGLLTAVLYLMMSYPLSLVARRLERRFPKVT
jgi:polar amino acid transport system substrate-binding protein